MDNINKELKKNGMYLKKVPSKERTEQQCKIAVHQNPQAIKHVPYRLQSEELCKYALKRDPSVIQFISKRALSERIWKYAVKQDGCLLEFADREYMTERVCRTAIKQTVKALRFIPASLREDYCQSVTDTLIKSCLEWIQDDIDASVFLPSSVKSDPSILEYQKEQGCLTIGGSKYDEDNKSFVVQISFMHSTEESEGSLRKYRTIVSFRSFDDYYRFMNGNLEGAMLRNCTFEGVDLKQYDITGAVIHSDVLLKQGLYDSKFFDELLMKARISKSLVENNELVINRNYHYLRPIEDEGYRLFDLEKIPCFYVSDIHLLERITHYFKNNATREEVYAFIRALVCRMVDSIGTKPYYSFLLIAGDVTDIYDFAEVFYSELVKHWDPSHIVVVSGNHELWDPAINMAENIKVYRDFFGGLGISFLQNELLCYDDDALQGMKSPVVISEKQILDTPGEILRDKLSKCPIMFWGGIGFSGLNEKYNSNNLKYGPSFDLLPRNEARTLEIKESGRMDILHRKLSESLSEYHLVVLTHMRKTDWSNDPYVKNWIYVSGHDHRNYYEMNEERTVIADNQIGYHTENIGLKHFYIGSDYDIFINFADGIFEISRPQYLDFLRGKRISTDFNRDQGAVYMLKKNGVYMFFYLGKHSPSSKSLKLYILNGGNLRKTEYCRKDDISYYYERIDQYVKNVHNLMGRYGGFQEQVSQFIRNIGGSGKIHGCIIDVDIPTEFGGYSYSHLFVNPIDGTVTPYFAWDIKSRIVYKDLKTMLEQQKTCNSLLANYNELINAQVEALPVFVYKNTLEEWGTNDSVYDEGGYLYRFSRIIKSLQYCTDKNVVRVWNDHILDIEYVNRIMITHDPEEVMDERLLTKY